ncbi:thymidylate synthase [Klebsiella phage vB_KpnP_P184]|uniref:Flavin-dependent thymidylate synthase n=1 Tax=Klebsiella phage vB_KpnP_P184 TaxID=2806547 RepID=A0A898KC79_9CAUD|nr:thymidylate synthase [Klebsiella phage vB_KpnP_P184]QSJ03734.1 flavin-dependent thymidylate synthase [Klebsiella phage vB_KpnP_P184]
MTQQVAEYIDHMGDDKRVVDVARISFGPLKKVTTPEQDASLIRFLANGVTSKDKEQIIKWIIEGIDPHYIDDPVETARQLYEDIRHQAVHWTPFAHTAITLRMKAPIPIRTQCFKHKQGLVENEESRRYISVTPEIFIPEFRQKPEGSIKQGSAGIHEANDYWKRQYIYHTQEAVALYEKMIEDGVAPEQARFVLPQGAMVNWIWTGNLLAFANFFNKRSDSHAQQEIQDLAHAVAAIVEPLFPVSWAALTKS